MARHQATPIETISITTLFKSIDGLNAYAYATLFFFLDLETF